MQRKRGTLDAVKSSGEGSDLRLGVSGESCQARRETAPLLGALPSRASAVGSRRGTAPRGFLGRGRGWDGEAGPRRRGRGAIRGRGPGLPGFGVPARRPPAARRGAALLPGGRCILRVSTRGCGRKEGIRPLHTSPLVRHAHSLAPARSLPRSPSLSRSHTRAHTPPRLPLSRPLSLRLLRGGRRAPDSPARPRRGSRPTQRPEAAGLGEPRAAPRGKSAGCRVRGSRIAAEGRLARPGGSPPWPAGVARQAARGGWGAREPPAAGGARVPAPGPRVPLLSAGRAGREFPTSKLSPARSRAAASLPGARGPHPPAHPAPSNPACRAPRSRRDPRGSPGGSARGRARAPKGGWGGGAQPQPGGRDPGVPGAHPPPPRHPLLWGFDSRAPPRGGVRAGKYRTA